LGMGKQVMRGRGYVLMSMMMGLDRDGTGRGAEMCL
jgi:hypothetical protein